jgi:ketosteroid isomerase-like protein
MNIWKDYVTDPVSKGFNRTKEIVTSDPVVSTAKVVAVAAATSSPQVTLNYFLHQQTLKATQQGMQQQQQNYSEEKREIIENGDVLFLMKEKPAEIRAFSFDECSKLSAIARRAIHSLERTQADFRVISEYNQMYVETFSKCMNPKSKA